MNLQGLTVIFAIILLPIIIVVSVYLQGQIDTIALQTKYDNMLLDSTHDAVIALENNIANEDLSTVSDSLRSMIEASTNVFMNNIATNMGLSNAAESYIRPYIPALLYTLYDGFYIYSPTSVPEIYTNSDGVALRVGDTDDSGNPVSADGKKTADNYGQIVYKTKDGKYTTDLNKAEKHIKYVLKSYMYYNANYVGGDKSSGSNYNISVNYSLDNYISLSGTIGKVYYSKSGYLINPNKVTSLTLDNNISNGKIEGIEFNPTGSSLNNKEEVFYKKYGSIINNMPSDKNLLSFKDEAIIEDFCKLDGIQLEVTLNDEEGNTILISNHDSNFPTEKKDELISQATDAICYYGKAKIFSDWVNEKLKMINPSDENVLNNIAFEYSTTFLKEEKGIEALKIDSNIFDLKKNDPEDITSDFWEHKREVIKSSIQYNLNLAISNYSSISSNQDYQMPILSETEWDKVLSNISMVSFMQDLPCKGKTYNNYAIVTSANSELIVIPDNLYFVPAEQGDNAIVINSDKSVSEYKEYEYHRIDCEKLSDSGPYYYLGYRSIEYLYDRKYENKQYEYDHKNFACYYCIVTGNYTKNALDENRKRAYYTVLGKERNNLYKTTATVDNYGFEVTDFGNSNNIGNDGTLIIKCSRPLDEVRSIEVVITKTEMLSNRTKNLVDLKLEIGNVETTLTINANKNTTQTIVWNNIASEKRDDTRLSIKNIDIDPKNELTTCNIASVKVIYK